MNLRIASAVAALVLAAAPAQAVITSITLSGGSTVSVSAPANLSTIGAGVTAFNEAQNVLMPTGPAGNRPAVLPAPDFVTPVSILPASQRFSSHFFVFRHGAPTGRTNFSGTITFNQNIVGIQRTTAQITPARSAMLRVAGVDYTTDFNGLEATGVNSDALTVVNSKTLDFNLNSNAAGDMFAVITAVPEASTWAMMLTGFGLVGVGARRRRAAVAA